MNYMVEWRIDLHADSPRDAAKQALAILQDPGNAAKLFNVYGDDTITRVDLDFEEEK